MPLDAESLNSILLFLERAVAAGVGAWAAFRLQATREARKERGNRMHALREALFVLSSQRSFLLSLSSAHLDPLRSEPERHLLLRPTVAIGAVRTQDLAKFTFLIQYKDCDLISRLDLAETQFQNALALLRERSQLHLRMQDRLPNTKTQVPNINSDELSGVVGRAVVQQLRHMTDGLYRAVDEALATNRECVTLTQEFIRANFPKERVPRVIEGEK